ncbi:Keratin-associated protein like [Actinidia chinensis var. chinensis]|uniref:Keratin-associated protein like n=1 Tax=Actinidia chinensis var. chinensis TaxID=1590841 RepID=A0A2R6QHE0_ACTCC|nr:Keratin-associated protein like [Actinidia chinensis var. chinensis]
MKFSRKHDIIINEYAQVFNQFKPRLRLRCNATAALNNYCLAATLLWLDALVAATSLSNAAPAVTAGLPDAVVAGCNLCWDSIAVGYSLLCDIAAAPRLRLRCNATAALNNYCLAATLLWLDALVAATSLSNAAPAVTAGLPDAVVAGCSLCWDAIVVGCSRYRSCSYCCRIVNSSSIAIMFFT